MEKRPAVISSIKGRSRVGLARERHADQIADTDGFRFKVFLEEDILRFRPGSQLDDAGRGREPHEGYDDNIQDEIDAEGSDPLATPTNARQRRPSSNTHKTPTPTNGHKRKTREKWHQQTGSSKRTSGHRAPASTVQSPEFDDLPAFGTRSEQKSLHSTMLPPAFPVRPYQKMSSSFQKTVDQKPPIPTAMPFDGHPRQQQSSMLNASPVPLSVSRDQELVTILRHNLANRGHSASPVPLSVRREQELIKTLRQNLANRGQQSISQRDQPQASFQNIQTPQEYRRQPTIHQQPQGFQHDQSAQYGYDAQQSPSALQGYNTQHSRYHQDQQMQPLQQMQPTAYEDEIQQGQQYGQVQQMDCPSNRGQQMRSDQGQQPRGLLTATTACSISGAE